MLPFIPENQTKIIRNNNTSMIPTNRNCRATSKLSYKNGDHCNNPTKPTLMLAHAICGHLHSDDSQGSNTVQMGIIYIFMYIKNIYTHTFFY